MKYLNVCALFLIAALSLPVSADDGFFLAIGGIDGNADDGHKLEGQFGTIYTSPDGEEWTQVFKGGPITAGFNHANNNLLRCATYGIGRFVVTGNPKCVLVSKDAKSWNIVDAPNGAFSVEFGNGMFLAPDAYGFMASTDGLVWKQVRPHVEFPIWGKEGAGHVRKIVYGNGVFVCIGDQRIGVTKDGTSWLHHRLLPDGQRPGRSVILFGNDRFVWLTQNLPPQSSADGIYWEPITTFADLPTNPAFGQSGVFDGTKFLTSASSYKNKHNVIYSSTDGIHWSKAVENAKGTSFTTAGNGLLLQNQGWSRSFTYSADEGKTWKQVKADIPSRKVYFFDGKRIIGQSGG